jgi:hypothetical protein
MSQWPQPDPLLSYQTPPPHGNAPLLVRLAGIFLIVAAGFDLLYAIGMGVLSGFMYYMITTAPPPRGPGGPPPALLALIYAVPGTLSLLVCGPILFGAIRLLRGGSRTWAWGLTSAILCCCHIWMFMGCCAVMVIPIGAGVYSIVILCLSNVRQYLQGGAYPASYPPPPSPRTF